MLRKLAPTDIILWRFDDMKKNSNKEKNCCVSTGAIPQDFQTYERLTPQLFKVTITEILKLTVEVEADDQYDAEQLVTDNWNNGEYILGAEEFVSAEFEVTTTSAQPD